MFRFPTFFNPTSIFTRPQHLKSHPGKTANFDFLTRCTFVPKKSRFSTSFRVETPNLLKWLQKKLLRKLSVFSFFNFPRFLKAFLLMIKIQNFSGFHVPQQWFNCRRWRNSIVSFTTNFLTFIVITKMVFRVQIFYSKERICGKSVAFIFCFILKIHSYLVWF